MKYDIAEQKVKEIIVGSNPSEILQDCVDFLYEKFNKYSWVGIYLVKGKDLILGPWRGKQATNHKKISIGKGICGSAAESGRTEIVADVSSDKRYLACFNSTQSEIVVPIVKNKNVLGEIDIDSNFPNAFNKKDRVFLERIADMLAEHI